MKKKIVLNYDDTTHMVYDANELYIGCHSSIKRLEARIAALEHPAQPQQEPVFWYKPYPNGMYNGPIHNAQIGDVLIGSEEWIPLYTSPPVQRNPLTVEKILHLVDTYVGAPSMSYPLDSSDWINFARAIEAKLKERNT